MCVCFRDKNIAIMFEKENINTLDMNGEMLLTILSFTGTGRSGIPFQKCENGITDENETGRTGWI